MRYAQQRVLPLVSLVGLTTLGQPRLSEGAQPYLKFKRQGQTKEVFRT